MCGRLLITIVCKVHGIACQATPLFSPGENGEQSTSGLPSAFISAEIRDLPIKQGGTGVIKVKTIPNVTLGGILVDHQLHFFPMEDGTQVALQGVHACFHRAYILCDWMQHFPMEANNPTNKTY